jgi:hypothetical protein
VCLLSEIWPKGRGNAIIRIECYVSIHSKTPFIVDENLVLFIQRNSQYLITYETIILLRI